jgi:hypothetical protein
MSDNDDQDWFDLVAGREVPAADPAIRLEAMLVREALLAAKAQDEAAVPASPERDTARTQRLIERARRERLIGTGEPPGASAPAGRQRVSFALLPGWRAAVAFATVLALAIGIALLMPREQPPVEEGGTLRSGLPELVVKQVPEPAASAQALADALRAAGLSVETRQAGAFWYVETTVPDKPDAALVSAFEKAGIVGVRPGPLRVMFRGER